MPKRSVASQSNSESTINLENLPLNAFCHTGDVSFNKKVVWTGGPNTCIILFARTRHTLLCWHFAYNEDLDADKMESVKRQLDGLPLRGASFFLLPGSDRDPETWDLKPDCRTMVFRPGKDPTASRIFFMEFIRQFSWFDRIEFMQPAKDCKEFVVFLQSSVRPFFVKDDEFFERSVSVDATKTI